MGARTPSGRAAEKGIAMSTWDEPARSQSDNGVAQSTWDEPQHDFVSHMMSAAPSAPADPERLPDSEQRFVDAFKKGYARHERIREANAKPAAMNAGTAALNKFGAERRPAEAGSQFWGRLNAAQTPEDRSRVISAERQRLKTDIGRHDTTMQSLQDQHQRADAARRMQRLEQFERDTLGYVVPPSGQEMSGRPLPPQGRRPDEPLYDKEGRPSLRGQPAAPSAKVAKGPGEIVQFKQRGPDGELVDESPTDKEERIRRRLAGRIIDAHQVGPDGAALVRDPRLTSLRSLIEYKKSLREDEAARRRAAVQDRWASFHMGNDALGLGYKNMPLARAQGLYMRSLARAAGENDPLGMVAVNQAHGNLAGANQAAAIAANRDVLSHQHQMAAMNAQMIRDQRQQDTPSGRAALLKDAYDRALALPEDQRLPAVAQVETMAGAADPQLAAKTRIAMHEAGAGNVNHAYVFDHLHDLPEPARVSWLLTHWRPNGQMPTREQAEQVAAQLRSVGEHAWHATIGRLLKPGRPAPAGGGGGAPPVAPPARGDL